MKKITIFASALILGSAIAGTDVAMAGSGDLALAALVGAHSPNVTSRDKKALSCMLNGKLNFSFPKNKEIAVTADSVSCRSSDVDISAHDCTLKFGAATRTLKGREAHELYATLVENGIAGDGAAGSIFEALSHLDCTIKPSEVKEKGGGGAKCTSKPGP